MKVNKLIYSIREGVKEYTDDSELDDRLILFKIDIKRAKYLSQRINSYTTALPSSAIQNLCIGMTDVNRYKCGVDVTCDSLRRSVEPMPEFFDTNTGNSLVHVKPVDIIGRPFTILDIDQVPYIEYATFAAQIFAFLDDDNYLYLISEGEGHKLINCVDVSGIFESPKDLQEYSNCCDCEDSEEDTSCFSLESEYPMSAQLIDTITQECIKEFLREMLIPEDKENNTNDDKEKKR